MTAELPRETARFERRVRLVRTLENRLPSTLKWLAAPPKAKLPELRHDSLTAAQESNNLAVLGAHNIIALSSVDLINGR